MAPQLSAVLVVLLANLAGIVGAAVPVHRLLQAEYEAAKVGSSTYSAEGHLALPHQDEKLFKAVMVLAVNSTSPERLTELMRQNSGLSGLLLVLPSHTDSAPMTATDCQQLVGLEQQLLSAQTTLPVFFTRDTPELSAAVTETSAMIARGHAPSRHSDRYEISLQGQLPQKLSAKQVTNYVATLRASDDQFKSGVPLAPTLLITSHYDAFSLAPAAAAGADAAASGAAASLLLLRLLHRLYASAETRPNRNILVLLTSGGPYAQQGLKQWLAGADPAISEALEGAIVLDSIGASIAVQQQQQQQEQASKDGTGSSSWVQSPQLHLHVNGSSSWAAAVAAAADRTGVPLIQVQQQQSEAHEAPHQHGSLGHEHLSDHGVAAVSLTYLSGTSRLDMPRLSSLSDTVSAVKLDSMLQATQVAADAVTRWLYPHLHDNHKLIDLPSEPQQHKDFLLGWMRLLTSADNMIPFDKAESGSSLLHDSLQQFMRAHSHTSKKHLWAPAGTPAAITAWTGTTAVMKVYKKAGFMLDMVLTAAVVVYLGALFAGLTIATRGYSELKAVFVAKPTRRNTRGGSRKVS